MTTLPADKQFVRKGERIVVFFNNRFHIGYVRTVKYNAARQSFNLRISHEETGLIITAKDVASGDVMTVDEFKDNLFDSLYSS